MFGGGQNVRSLRWSCRVNAPTRHLDVPITLRNCFTYPLLMTRGLDLLARFTEFQYFSAGITLNALAKLLYVGRV